MSNKSSAFSRASEYLMPCLQLDFFASNEIERGAFESDNLVKSLPNAGKTHDTKNI